MTIAEALKIIIDTNLYTKDDWAIVLNVGRSDIDVWLSGKEIPGGHHLFSISHLLKEDERFKDSRIAFEEAIDEVLPRKQQFITDFDPETKNHFDFLGQTLRHHMVRPRLHAVTCLLGTLNPYLQESLLQEFAVRIKQEKRKHGQIL